MGYTEGGTLFRSTHVYVGCTDGWNIPLPYHNIGARGRHQGDGPTFDETPPSVPGEVWRSCSVKELLHSQCVDEVYAPFANSFLHQDVND